jgi:hypothetical protein
MVHFWGGSLMTQCKIATQIKTAFYLFHYHTRLYLFREPICILKQHPCSQIYTQNSSKHGSWHDYFTSRHLHHTVQVIGKGKTIPVKGRGGPEVLIFSRQLAHRWQWGCQPYAPATLYTPGRFLVLISVKGWVNPRVIVWLEGLGQLKNPLTQDEVKSIWNKAVTDELMYIPGAGETHEKLQLEQLASWLRFKPRFSTVTATPIRLMPVLSMQNGSVPFWFSY